MANKLLEGRVFQSSTRPGDGQKSKLKVPKIPSRIWQTAGLVVGASAIFFFGWGIGSGKINLDGRTGNKQVANNLPASLNYSSANEVYNALKKNYDGKLETDTLLDGVKHGLATATGDPYTEYFTRDEYKEFNEQLTGTFSGIGAELGKDNESIVVIAPIAGFPAEKAGLKPKDIIIEVDGKSVYGIGVSEAVKRIRGPKGTTVKLKVVRGGQQQLDLTIERDNISIPSVESKVENNIGYLRISRFGEDTAKLARQAAQDFKQQNVKGVILDLRGDPGGLLDAAVDVSSLWVPQGKTVLSERREGVVVRNYPAEGNNILNGIPTVVLINEGSASASEITAGALKDNGMAKLIGEKTYGKGSVQQLVNLSDGGSLKVTIARWYTPSGRNIDKEGIEPDQKVTISDEDIKAAKDTQKEAALAEINK